jgi:hypothetical protein
MHRTAHNATYFPGDKVKKRIAMGLAACIVAMRRKFAAMR